MAWNNFNKSTQNEGGFMNTTVNDTLGGDDKGKVKRGNNCVPVMICQAVKYGDKIPVHGNYARLISLVAVVRNVESQAAKVTFELQDESGSIKGIKWLEGDNMTFESPVSINSYAKICGLIRYQNEEPYVLILRIKPMLHINELLAHLMEATVVSIESKKVSSVKNSQSADYSALNSTGNGNAMSGLNGQQKMVLEIIKNSDPDYGAERGAIKAKVPPNLASNVDEILDFLSAEGHIYTTKTDDYFKAI